MIRRKTPSFNETRIVCSGLLCISVARCAWCARARTYLTIPSSVCDNKGTRISAPDRTATAYASSCRPRIYNCCRTWDIDTAEVLRFVVAAAAVALSRSRDTNGVPRCWSPQSRNSVTMECEGRNAAPTISRWNNRDSASPDTEQLLEKERSPTRINLDELNFAHGYYVIDRNNLSFKFSLNACLIISVTVARCSSVQCGNK